MSKKSKKVSGRIEREKRRKKILFASIFVLISIVITAWYITSRPTPTGTLVVHTIEESTNEPLGGTTILVVGPYGYDAEVQSSEQGVYTFESIAAGAYLVAVRKTGYHTHTGSTMFPLGVDVEAGETTNITIELHGHD